MKLWTFKLKIFSMTSLELQIWRQSSFVKRRKRQNPIVFNLLCNAKCALHYYRNVEIHVLSVCFHSIGHYLLKERTQWFIPVTISTYSIWVLEPIWCFVDKVCDKVRQWENGAQRYLLFMRAVLGPDTVYDTVWHL